MYKARGLNKMIKTNKAYKFRAYPTEEQATLHAKTCGCVRKIWNRMLEDKIEFYKENGQMLHNTPAQYKDEFPFLREVDSRALCNAQMDLETAFKNFFRGKKIGFPKWKSSKKSKMAYKTNNINNSIRIENGKLRLPKIGLLEVVFHQYIPNNHKIKSVTFEKKPSGKYYVSILTEYETEIPQPTLNKDNAIGLDYSSPDFYVDSQNKSPDRPKFFRLAENKLAKEQRKLSHMKFGSNNYQNQKLKVARLHEKIANQRKDWIENVSTKLSNTYDYVFVENIDMKSLSQTLKLGKSTMDNGFGFFRQRLETKMLERGKVFAKINRWFPSSKTCRFCGCINKDLKLSDRIWVCECGAIIERDYNAALNILHEGLNSL